MGHTADVVIIGGGIIGASIAYHLCQDGSVGRVLVIERDTTYARASTALSLGGIRQQFGVPCNIEMARYSLRFYEDFDTHMAGAWGQPQAHFHQRGYLFLLNAQNRDHFLQKYDVQRRMGVEVELLTAQDVRDLIPHMWVEDITGAIYGRRDGYLNPRGALQGFVERSHELGCIWLQDEVLGFAAAATPTYTMQTRASGEVTTPALVFATGAWTPQLASLARLELPVWPVRRQACYVTLPDSLGYKLPMIIEANHIHYRHDTESDDHLVITRVIRDEPAGLHFEWDATQFSAHILPHLRRRLPACGDVRLQRGWAGHYAMTPDENPILGMHPEYPGLYMAVGFSGHGVMLAPAAGKALAELIRLGHYKTLNARPYRLERFRTGELIEDTQI